MLQSRKAISSHLLILGISSLLLAMILTTTMSFTYGDEHQDCKNVDFDIENQCKESKKVNFEIVNNANKQLSVQVGNKVFNIEGGSSKTGYQVTDQSKVVFMPIIEAGKVFECRGRVKKLNVEVLIKC